MSTITSGSRVKFYYITSFSFENLGSRFSVPFTKSLEFKIFEGTVTLVSDANPDSQEIIVTIALDDGNLLTINSNQII